MSLCIDNVVSNLLLSYINPKDWSPLIEELKKHKFVRLQWKILKNPDTAERDPKFCNTKAILFINTDSVIVQNVQMSVGDTRFKVLKIMFEDWNSVFVNWPNTDGRLERFMKDGCLMYGARYV